MSGRKTKGLLVGMMALGAVMVMPKGVEGQMPPPPMPGMTVSAGGCYPGMSFCQVDLFKLAVTDPPPYLLNFQLDLLNGWQFTSPLYEGQDSFGPIGPFLGSLATPSSLFLDFDRDFGFFELNYAGTEFEPSMETYLSLDMTGQEQLAFDWSAEDEFGMTYSGTVYGPTAVVPEPATVILMATGLLGVGAIHVRRRRRQDVEGQSGARR